MQEIIAFLSILYSLLHLFKEFWADWMFYFHIFEEAVLSNILAIV